MMRFILRTAAAAMFLAILTTCKQESGPVAPVEGVVEVALTTPAPDDGAVLFTISGSVVGEVQAASSDLLVLSGPASGGRLSVAVFGHRLNGALLRMTVPDVARISEYAVVIEEVAGPRNYLREDLSGYRLTLAP